jgi:ribosomal-protein-alanine N-acetyltransferase
MSDFDPTTFTPPFRVPELASPPVVLRPYAIADLAMVRQAAADPFIPSISSVPRTYTDDSGRAFIERQHARSAEGDGYSFVIARATDPKAGVGSIGLWLPEIESGRASIGYWLVSGARGKGLAACALRALVSFAFDALAIPRLHLFVEPWNVASARTAEAVGFEREATLRGWERIDGEQRDADCFAFLRSEWVEGLVPGQPDGRS